MPDAKIRKGALTIPIDIRKKANLEDGTLVSVEYKSIVGPFSDIKKALR